VSSVLEGILSLIFVSVALGAGVYVMAQTNTIVSLAETNSTTMATHTAIYSLSSNQSASIGQLFSSAYSIYNLLAIVLIVLIAVGILALIISVNDVHLPKRKPKVIKPANQPIKPKTPDVDGDGIPKKKKKVDGDFG
jgi:hypothetical protein